MLSKKCLLGVITAITVASTALPATATAAEDTTPPPTPSGFAITQRTSSSLNFNWGWTSDNGGYVPRYELSYVDKKILIDHAYPGHTQNITGLDVSPGKAYSFELRAIDHVGNKSLIPARLVFETTPPGQASNLRLASTRQGYPDIITFTAAPDNFGHIASYEIFLNGESLGTTGSPATTFSLFDQVYLIACIEPPSGPATVQLRAIDASFNPSPQLSAPLTVVFP
jgi:hypothetical protein